MIIFYTCKLGTV